LCTRIITSSMFSHHCTPVGRVRFVSGHRFSDAVIRRKRTAFRRWTVQCRFPFAMRINRTRLPTNVLSLSPPRHGENAGFSKPTVRLSYCLTCSITIARSEKYLLHEFVIMPDHIHLLITVDAEMTVEKAIQLIKGGFSFRAGRELGFRAPVWQKGFSEIRVHDPTAYVGIREYIHANPVRRFLVVSAADYAYSSAHPGFALDPPPQRLKARLEAEAFGIAKAMP